MRGPVIIAVAALMVVASRQACHVSDRQVVQQAEEDSLRLASFYGCQATLPGLHLMPREIVYRAPGRYQVVRRREKDQIACITWQGQVQYVDTAIIQPGNGDVTTPRDQYLHHSP